MAFCAGAKKWTRLNFNVDLSKVPCIMECDCDFKDHILHLYDMYTVEMHHAMRYFRQDTVTCYAHCHNSSAIFHQNDDFWLVNCNANYTAKMQTTPQLFIDQLHFVSNALVIIVHTFALWLQNGTCKPWFKYSTISEIDFDKRNWK